MSELTRYQCGPVSIYGRSVAGQFSGFVVGGDAESDKESDNTTSVPFLDNVDRISTGFCVLKNIWLDCGNIMSPLPTDVLLTHTHWDHMSHLTTLCLRADKPFRVFCHPKAYDYLKEFLLAFTRTRACNSAIKWCENLTRVRLTPLDPLSDPVELKPGFLVKSVELEHRIPTVGYVILQKGTKLNPVYHGLPHKELMAIKEKGECITIDVVTPILAYLCDCTSKSLLSCLRTMVIEDSLPKVVMCECTFIEESDRGEALKRKHVCWVDIESTLISMKTVQFVLIHVSKRYDESQLSKFEKKLPANVSLFKNK